ncbi:unnamed protein product [Urochloa decumbens]|uniref:Uncharacterized protein n=1 Tax=Urochloa decumbens TaxID=240449 RepID=A0ABC8Z4B7_9POAL
MSRSRDPCASLRPSSSLMQRCWRLGGAAVCCAAPLHICDEAMRWVSSTAAATLMFAPGTTIHRSCLVPLFALQAPSGAISWIKGDYGRWIAFLGLLLRLLYFIPGELELPLPTTLLVMTAPYQFMVLRESEDGGILSTAIVVYLAFQHFIGVGSLRKAFGRESIVATLAIITLMLLLGTYDLAKVVKL